MLFNLDLTGYTEDDLLGFFPPLFVDRSGFILLLWFVVQQGGRRNQRTTPRRGEKTSLVLGLVAWPVWLGVLLFVAGPLFVVSNSSPYLFFSFRSLPVAVSRLIESSCFLSPFVISATVRTIPAIRTPSTPDTVFTFKLRWEEHGVLSGLRY